MALKTAIGEEWPDLSIEIDRIALYGGSTATQDQEGEQGHKAWRVETSTVDHGNPRQTQKATPILAGAGLRPSRSFAFWRSCADRAGIAEMPVIWGFQVDSMVRAEENRGPRPLTDLPGSVSDGTDGRIRPLFRDAMQPHPGEDSETGVTRVEWSFSWDAT